MSLVGMTGGIIGGGTGGALGVSNDADASEDGAGSAGVEVSSDGVLLSEGSVSPRSVVSLVWRAEPRGWAPSD